MMGLMVVVESPRNERLARFSLHEAFAIVGDLNPIQICCGARQDGDQHNKVKTETDSCDHNSSKD